MDRLNDSKQRSQPIQYRSRRHNAYGGSDDDAPGQFQERRIRPVSTFVLDDDGDEVADRLGFDPSHPGTLRYGVLGDPHCLVEVVHRGPPMLYPRPVANVGRVRNHTTRWIRQVM